MKLLAKLVTISAGLIASDGENPEYTRGQAELIAYATGFNGDDVEMITHLIEVEAANL